MKRAWCRRRPSPAITSAAYVAWKPWAYALLPVQCCTVLRLRLSLFSLRCVLLFMTDLLADRCIIGSCGPCFSTRLWTSTRTISSQETFLRARCKQGGCHGLRRLRSRRGNAGKTLQYQRSDTRSEAPTPHGAASRHSIASRWRVGQCASRAAGCNETGASRRAGQCNVGGSGYFGERIHTPQGRPPTGSVFTVVKVAVSITLTLLERPSAVYSLAPSAVSAMFHARLP